MQVNAAFWHGHFGMSPYINSKNRENIRKKISLPNGSPCAEIYFFDLTEKAIWDALGHLLEGVI